MVPYSGFLLRRRRSIPAALLLTLLLVLFAGLSLQVSAESAVRVVMDVAPTTIAPGGDFVVEVHLMDCPALSALGPLTIQLDASRFTLVSIDRGPTLPIGLTTSEKDGQLLISYADTSAGHQYSIPQAADILLCTIRFKALATAPVGDSTLALTGVAGFETPDGTVISAYSEQQPPVVVKSAAEITPDPTTTPSIAASGTPGQPSPTGSSTITPTPTPAPGASSDNAPSWLWTAWIVTLAVAFIEFLLLVGRKRRRPARRR